MHPPPVGMGANIESMLDSKEEALDKAGEVQDALLWMTRRKVDKARREGATELVSAFTTTRAQIHPPT